MFIYIKYFHIAGAEAKNPSRAIPFALIGSLSTALIVYCGISSTFTLMWPYYDQVLTYFDHKRLVFFLLIINDNGVYLF